MKNLKYFIVIAAIFITAVAAHPNKDKYFEIVKNLDIFATLYKEVNAYYVDEVNPSTVMRTGIEAMLASLDPYTNYIPEDDIENYRTAATGEYAGIGAIVDVKDGVSTIILPYEGFAADRAGLKIGDQIIRLNGIHLKDKSTAETRQLLNGQARSEITLKIRRYGVEKLFDVKLKREKIIIKNVPFHGMVNESIGYMRLTDFTTKAGNEVRGALLDLKELGAEKIILDLRGNPGGLLNEAVNICNVFIPQNMEVVTTRGKMEEWTQLYNTLNLSTDTEIPLAVLISNGSASASEIVSGVMQDYDRGVLIGRKSYGKGLVQQTRPLAYNSQLKVTTAKYYIPSGRCIQALDYSNRNPDGSVGKVPDSLKSEFATANGRLVFDGGGVDPDILVERHDYAPVTLSLLQNNLIFHYATEYHFEHDSIANPKIFRLSEKDYASFVTWVESKNFSYQTELEYQLNLLGNIAQGDVNYEEIKPAISALENSISDTKQKDLQTYNYEIQTLLEQEITSRYYLERGMIESTFEKDRDILKAVEVLSDLDQYNKFLQK
ncbi:MAG: S41 family peptidase [Cytophagales bacterium]|nr:S41 family peptidase [Cytophagales bacterium]